MVRILSIEIGLWAAGAVIVAAYCAARTHADVQRQEGIAAFTAARPAAGGAQRIFTEQVPDQSRWSDGRIRAYAGLGIQRPTTPKAVLRIPTVKLAVPVYADTSARNLNRGAGLIAGTAQPGERGNIAIAAHRDGFFRALEDLAVGDLLELQSLSGTRTYRVSQLSVVSPDDVRPLRQTEAATVTLVTCHPFYFVGNAPQRYIVRALAVD